MTICSPQDGVVSIMSATSLKPSTKNISSLPILSKAVNATSVVGHKPEALFSSWFQKHLPTNWHYQRIETTTGRGVPDAQVCARRQGLLAGV
jgi:hypothetical protein